LVQARDARDWAKEHLRGVCDSLYTPFSGRDGDEVDYEALRFVVRYALGDLDHDGLWLTSGLAEFWALTTDERKRIAEVTIEEARQVKPNAIIQVATVASSAKETVELTLHAQDLGADLCYLQNPFMETHGGEGTLEFFKYVADRTDIGLGMFNSPCSGFELTPAECARIANEVPAVCAIKDAAETPAHHGVILAGLAPELVTWGIDIMEYHAGMLQRGLQSPCLLGATAYLSETPSDRRQSEWFNLVLEGKVVEAAEYYYSAGVGTSGSHGLSYTCDLPSRPGYYTHWGSAFKYSASLLGLPVGDYPHSRPPQLKLSEQDKHKIEDAYIRSGLISH
jgi:4-hydroxy-tetrahydrodipicolinate synthase